jgi:hypothetical protein
MQTGRGIGCKATFARKFTASPRKGHTSGERSSGEAADDTAMPVRNHDKKKTARGTQRKVGGGCKLKNSAERRQTSMRLVEYWEFAELSGPSSVLVDGRDDKTKAWPRCNRQNSMGCAGDEGVVSETLPTSTVVVKAWAPLGLTYIHRRGY